ncbi:NAD(P)/FAD-dependent oxidoreductase [Rhodococcus rhodochrous]|uniref:FAD-dependent oxidoreductase n=1 Tax=Rhodococcus rhodochrous TaxID=1829 RepID=A0AA46WX34_RHORH|nr:FAD-dependent oxidoreductase [Rhodococcus rhodochrous]UZF45707.1 FAD-dependent oxidoreductase [Rhodococcus rhodochrous]
MNHDLEDIAIVGGGLAAIRTAQGLRGLGFGGRIHMYSDESEPPYDRPPLSKDFLTGALDTGGLHLLNPKALATLNLDIHLDSEVVALDPGGRRLTLADGTTVPYGRLVVATGAQARRLPGLAPSPRIHYLRTVDDARALRTALANASRITVVGTGFIGLEVASSIRHLGLEVDVVAADEGPMIGIVGRRLSRWLTDLHTAHGVRLTNSVVVSSVEESATDVSVTLGDGTSRSSDLVVVGVGVSRELQWLREAGLEVDRGLVCDADGRTSDPFVFGVGDIVCLHTGAEHEDLQHWTAAIDSARRTAHALLGIEHSHDPSDGFFWTEQHGRRLQFVGTGKVDAETDVLSGSIEEGKFVAHLRSGSTVTGVFASNSPREFLEARRAFQKQTAASTAG